MQKPTEEVQVYHVYYDDWMSPYPLVDFLVLRPHEDGVLIFEDNEDRECPHLLQGCVQKVLNQCFLTHEEVVEWVFKDAKVKIKKAFDSNISTEEVYRYFEAYMGILEKFMTETVMQELI